MWRPKAWGPIAQATEFGAGFQGTRRRDLGRKHLAGHSLTSPVTDSNGWEAETNIKMVYFLCLDSEHQRNMKKQLADNEVDTNQLRYVGK